MNFVGTAVWSLGRDVTPTNEAIRVQDVYVAHDCGPVVNTDGLPLVAARLPVRQPGGVDDVFGTRSKLALCSSPRNSGDV